MALSERKILLLVDDNALECDLLETAWAEAGYREVIDLHACATCERAVTWLHGSIFQALTPIGILVDLLLTDRSGQLAVDTLAAYVSRMDLPIWAWSGIQLGRSEPRRVTRHGVRFFRKPEEALGFTRFAHRLFSNITGRSEGSSSRLPIA
jgi:hypothetical protein